MKNLSSRKSLVLLAVIVLNIVNALVGILGNVVSKDIESILFRAGISQYLIQITAGLLIFGLLVAAWVFKAEKDAAKDQTPAEIVPESEKATRAFLADLATRYNERNVRKLDGRYEISLVVSDDVEGTSVRQFDEEFDADPRSLGAAQYIIERFERQGRLLIVGSPGAGKTVLLLNLAKYLAEKATEDARQPLPVIFNLDSWSSDYERFDDWIIAMLTKAYGLSREFARQLLAEQRIIFLLDGLDELARNKEAARAAEVRAACIAALDKSLHDGTMNVVICCRREEFNAMLRQTDAEPPVAAVVVARDLTAAQIDRALVRASQTTKDRFAAPHLLAALGQDYNGVYEQVLSTPFYFTTALQVFDSTKPPVIDASDKEKLEANLIAAFIDKKLEVTQNAHRFPADRTLAWLTWLANFLDIKSAVTFELADLQPSALKKPWHYRLAFCMIFGAVGGTLFGGFKIIGTIFILFLFGMIGPFIVTENLSQWALAPLQRWRTWRNIFLQSLVGGGLLSAVFLSWLLWGQGMARMWQYPVAFLMMLIIFMPVVVGTIVLFRVIIRLIGGVLSRAVASRITTEDSTQWALEPLRHWITWRKILARVLGSSVSGGIIFGTVLCSLSVMAVVAVYEDADFGKTVVFVAIFGLVLGALLGAAIGVIIGLLLGIIKACRRTARLATIHSPYQRLRAGISFSILQTALMAVCLLGPLPMMVRSYRGIQALPLEQLVIFSTLVFVIFGFLGFFRTSLLKHLVLRACLTLQGAMPLRYAKFLAYATELGLLERDGGQWRFRHQFLQDYFAQRLVGSENDANLIKTRYAITPP